MQSAFWLCNLLTSLYSLKKIVQPTSLIYLKISLTIVQYIVHKKIYNIKIYLSKISNPVKINVSISNHCDTFTTIAYMVRNSYYINYACNYYRTRKRRIHGITQCNIRNDIVKVCYEWYVQPLFILHNCAEHLGLQSLYM